MADSRASWRVLLGVVLVLAVSTARAQEPPAAPPPLVLPTASETEGDKPKDDAKADKPAEPPKGLTDSLHLDDDYGLKSLFDSLNPRDAKRKPWYEKLSLRGYTQFRFGRSLYQDALGGDPSLFGDRSINGSAENFSIRRMRLILSGDVSDHLGIYIQPDFGNTPAGGINTFFGQLRDAYGDVYLDKEKVHRVRVGLSKVPYGWENMQSSQNRIPLDRSNPLNSSVPNERDLGVFYYWTPEDKQKLLKDLVDGGLKGSGNYGLFGFGAYNGQASHILEQNQNLHLVARLTYPFRLADGQVVEASVQGYTGEFVPEGAAIRARGRGAAITPAGTRAAGERAGHLDQRIAGTFVWYPQPFGFQTEWNWGTGPGLNDAQTAVVERSLHGGYALAMYKIETCSYGIVTPFTRWQYYRGGYKSIANAPYGTHRELALGCEWQIRKEMELVAEYGFVDGVSLTAVNQAGVTPYRNYDGGVLRIQFQINY